MRYRMKIVIRRKSGVADPEGNTIANTLERLGHSEVSSVRVAKLFYIDIDGKDEYTARNNAEKIAKEVLANPVIEEFEIIDIEKI